MEKKKYIKPEIQIKMNQDSITMYKSLLVLEKCYEESMFANTNSTKPIGI